MINFIKDAVTAVNGIKTFLFNTDYRNNFDLQDVEFPCCVLTPIMRTNYDLNNIIRESAELQLSVVDLAPFEYTGDDLYAINKRCSDLALQVIANLQVKSKLDKELTFGFILPSGDELVSGVMCNLTATMRQGSCIGAPSYVEVVVQTIKRDSITSNGKYIIAPSSGFNAMKEVEVDVDVPSAKIEPTKQVTFNDNTATTITPSEGYDALESVDVVVDVQPNLQDKQLTITENGTQTIVADEGFEGLSSVEVTTDVNTLQGLDFSSIYDQKQASELNQYYKDGIAYAEGIKRNWNDIASTTNRYRYNSKLLYFPKVTHNAPKSFLNYFQYSALSKIEDDCLDLPNVTAMSNWASYTPLRRIIINAPKLTNMQNIFRVMPLLEYAEILSTIENVTNITNAFQNCYNLITLKIKGWKQDSINLADSSNLSVESIDYNIENAIDKVDGAEEGRTLQLHATAGANWDANSKYQGEERKLILTQKGIEVTW